MAGSYTAKRRSADPLPCPGLAVTVSLNAISGSGRWIDVIAAVVGWTATVRRVEQRARSRSGSRIRIPPRRQPRSPKPPAPSSPTSPTSPPTSAASRGACTTNWPASSPAGSRPVTPPPPSARTSCAASPTTAPPSTAPAASCATCFATCRPRLPPRPRSQPQAPPPLPRPPGIPAPHVRPAVSPPSASARATTYRRPSSCRSRRRRCAAPARGTAFPGPAWTNGPVGARADSGSPVQGVPSDGQKLQL